MKCKPKDICPESKEGLKNKKELLRIHCFVSLVNLTHIWQILANEEETYFYGKELTIGSEHVRMIKIL